MYKSQVAATINIFLLKNKRVKNKTYQLMKKTYTLLSLFFSLQSFSQVGIGTSSINSSAILDVTSTNKGLLPPRMTYVQKVVITTPKAGLLIWCTDCGTNGEMQIYNGTSWRKIIVVDQLGAISGAPTSPIALAGNGQASVSFTAPIDTGTSGITGYTVTSTPGNLTGIGTVSPIVVTGLTPGTSYTFEVVATNAAGNSSASSSSAAIIPFVSAICDGTQLTTIVEITSSTGKIWMDRNLGASRAAISATDFMAYGCLFQWGRGNDGHGSINWTSATTGAPVNGSTATSSATDTPGNALFIINGTGGDWRSSQNINLWQGVNGVNNPCPAGYRVPTEIELDNERLTWVSQNPDGAFASLLKLPLGGYRNKGNASLSYIGKCGRYLASTTNSSVSRALGFNGGSMPSSPNTAGIYSLYRADAESIRCIKN
jgi:hypothetical protein